MRVFKPGSLIINKVNISFPQQASHEIGDFSNRLPARVRYRASNEKRSMLPAGTARWMHVPAGAFDT